MTTQPDTRIVINHPDIVGECPIWDSQRHALLWTDNRAERVYRYTPASDTFETVVDGHQVYAFTLQQDGSLLLFMNNTRIAHAALNADTSITTIIDSIPGEEQTRFNDVIVDRAGRILCGVLPTQGVSTGSLYSLDANGGATKIHDDLALPNGMAFSPNEHLLYVADTRANHVLVFDYDLATGSVDNQRTFATFPNDEDGAPDGLTVDIDGNVWIAATGSGAVSRYAPDGTLTQRVALDARKPTSLGFGGDDMATLYVTSSSRAPNGEELGPEAGALFAFPANIPGPLEHRTDWRV